MAPSRHWLLAHSARLIRVGTLHRDGNRRGGLDSVRLPISPPYMALFLVLMLLLRHSTLLLQGVLYLRGRETAKRRLVLIAPPYGYTREETSSRRMFSDEPRWDSNLLESQIHPNRTGLFELGSSTWISALRGAPRSEGDPSPNTHGKIISLAENSQNRRWAIDSSSPE